MNSRGQLAAITALAIHLCGNAAAQTPDRRSAAGRECMGAVQQAMLNVNSGYLAEAAENLLVALRKFGGPAGGPCAGLILHNLATIASISGRFSDAEHLAERSIAALESVYAKDDPALWRPLMVLAGARLEQGKKPAVRANLNRLRAIQPELPQDRALIHGTVASVLQQLGEHEEAELEYVAALQAWDESGRGQAVETVAVLTSLATLLIEDRRLEEAERAVERAVAILYDSNEALPMDHSKLLMVRGALHARRREWPDAEIDFRDALTIADGQPAIDTSYVLQVLTNFREALNKNHHGKEARRVEARATALRVSSPWLYGVVDAYHLHERPKSVGK